MSKDTKDNEPSDLGNFVDSSDNVDPTVQISNAELAAIRRSATQPEFTPELLAKMDRQRALEEARQRESTPRSQFAHPSIADEKEDSDNDPTRSFDRDRINSMLRGESTPELREDNESPEESEPPSPQDADENVVDALLADAVIAESLRASAAEDEQDASATPGALEKDHHLDVSDANSTADEVAHHDESLTFLDDVDLRDIVFGDERSEEVRADSAELDALDVQEVDHSELDDSDFEDANFEDYDERSPVGRPSLVEEPSELESANAGPAHARSARETSAEMDADAPSDSLPAVGHDAPDHEPSPAESRTTETLSEPEDIEAPLEWDELMPRRTHPMVTLCGIAGLLAICAGVVGLLLPDAALALDSTLNMVVLAAGALLLFGWFILRP